MTLSTAKDGIVSLGKERHSLCMEVAYQLEALALVLPDLVPNVAEAYPARHAVRSIAGRFVELANALMAALGDDAETTERLEIKVMVST